MSEKLNATITIKGSFAPGTKLVEVVGCVDEETDAEGSLSFRIDGGPKAFYSRDGLEGSGLCGRKLVRVVKGGENGEEGKGNGTSNGTANGTGEENGGKGEKKSGAVSMQLKVRASFAGGALGVLFLGAMVWL